MVDLLFSKGYEVMMKKTICISLIIALLLTGCGSGALPELPEDAIAFQTESYTYNGMSKDEFYYTFEYNGRKYIGYGSVKGFLWKKHINSCIGYIMQQDSKDKVRIYTLNDDEDCNFLIEYVIDDKDLMTPFVWRAEDTKGQDIEIPKYIVSETLYEKIWN